MNVFFGPRLEKPPAERFEPGSSEYEASVLTVAPLATPIIIPLISINCSFSDNSFVEQKYYTISLKMAKVVIFLINGWNNKVWPVNT